ncbi:MAG TPA: AraC family transcriptional regulator [Thermoanaerobaculia bacterium]|nr:AraC family transcriptional regulator [Thermoanaerobaculia bacterium]
MNDLDTEPRESARFVPGIDIDWLFVSSSLRISRWRCQAQSPELSGDRCQPWHVLGFTHVGAFVMQTEGRSLVVDANTVMLHSPGIPYRTAHPFGGGDRGSSLVLRPGVLREMVARYDPARVESAPETFRFPAPHAICPPKGYLLQRLLFELLSRPNGADLMRIEETGLSLAESAIRECFRRVVPVKRQARAATVRQHRECVEAAKGLLVERFREPLRLDDLALQLNVSSCHLARLFKRETGLPIHRYLNRLRLRCALEGLPECGRDLTSLAFDLGFSSHSHFSASFGQEFGLTPSQVQQIAHSGHLPESFDRRGRAPQAPARWAGSARSMISALSSALPAAATGPRREATAAYLVSRVSQSAAI